MPASLNIPDIVDTSLLQAVIDHFSERTNLASGILDEHARPITYQQNHCDFCKAKRSDGLGRESCRRSDLNGIKVAKATHKMHFYRCESGLIDFCAPLTASGQIVGYFFGGQFQTTISRFAGPRPVSGNSQPPPSPSEADSGKGEVGADLSLHRPYLISTEADFERLEMLATDYWLLINGILDKLSHGPFGEVFRAFLTRLEAMNSIEDLLGYTISQLPNLVSAGASSVFFVQYDQSVQRERLVLRATSFQKLQQSEKAAYYEKGEGCTGWVWQTGRTLKVNDLRNPAELALYPGLYWKHKHDDSDVHASLLAAPLFGSRKEVLGVIRVPYKKTSLQFNLADEILLGAVAKHLGAALEMHRMEFKYQRAMQLSKCAIDIAGKWERDSVLRAASDWAGRLFAHSDHRVFVNIFSEQTAKWHTELTQGSLDLQSEYGRGAQFGLGDGATGKAIRERKSFLSNDCLADSESGTYISSVVGGRCVMVAPILHQNACYGAIAVVGRRKYEYSVDSDLGILEALSLFTGAALHNACIAEQSLAERSEAYRFIIRSVCHYVGNRTFEIENKLANIRDNAAAQEQGGTQHEVSAGCVQTIEQSLAPLKSFLHNLSLVNFQFEGGRSRFSIVELLRRLCGDYCAEFACESGSESELMVCGNSAAISALFREIFENCKRFAPPPSGRIRVSCFRKTDETGRAWVECIVEDNGPGVPPKWKESIFQDKFTSDKSGAHLGMGLFFARAIALANEGRLIEKGEYGRGAMFLVSLRVASECGLYEKKADTTG